MKIGDVVKIKLIQRVGPWKVLEDADSAQWVCASALVTGIDDNRPGLVFMSVIQPDGKLDDGCWYHWPSVVHADTEGGEANSSGTPNSCPGDDPVTRAMLETIRHTDSPQQRERMVCWTNTNSTRQERKRT